MPVAVVVPCRPTWHPGRIDVEIGGTIALALTPGDGMVRVGLVLPVLDRVVDMTFQPSASCAALHGVAARTRTPCADAEAATRAALAVAAGRARAWDAPADAPLLAALGGAAFPLLAAAYAEGKAPLPQIPRWAAPVLSKPSARAGCVQAFGVKATRPVVRALATGLTADDTAGTEADEATVQLVPLALALMGASVLEPDQLARVLRTRPCTEADDLPDGEQIRAARRCLTRWGARRAERVLVEAAVQDGGLRLLNRAVRFANDLGSHGPARLPNRLRDLHDVYRAATATDPGPRPPVAAALRPIVARRPPPAPAPQRRRTGGPVPAAEAPVPVDRRDRIYAPASRLAPVDESCPLTMPAAATALEGLSTGDLTVSIPRTAGDLVRWSRLLSNCLYDYGPMAAAGQTTILGLRRAGGLQYAVEVRPPGIVRQFVGPANRPPQPADRVAVVALLADRGVVDRTHPANRIWLQP